MIRTINQYDFIDAFRKMGREENFSYNGLIALYEELEMVENDIGKPIELDVIALCCEYAEYDSLEEFQADYGNEYETIEDIQNATTVIMVEETISPLDNDSFIIQQF